MFRRRKNFVHELISVYIFLHTTNLLHFTEGGQQFNQAKTSLLLPHGNNVQVSLGPLSVDPEAGAGGEKNQTFNFTGVTNINLKNAGPLLSMLLVVDSSKNGTEVTPQNKGIAAENKLTKQKNDPLDPLTDPSSSSPSLGRDKRNVRNRAISTPVRKKKGHSHSKKNHMAIAGSTSIANEDTAVATADAKEGTAHEAKWAQAGALTWKGGSEALAASAAGKKDFHPTGNCKSCKNKTMLVATNPVILTVGADTVPNEIIHARNAKPSINTSPLNPLEEVKLVAANSPPIIQINNKSAILSEFSRGVIESKIEKSAVHESDSLPPVMQNSPIVANEEEKPEILSHEIIEDKMGRGVINILTTHTDHTKPIVAPGTITLSKFSPIPHTQLTLVDEPMPQVAGENIIVDQKMPPIAANPFMPIETKVNVSENFVFEQTPLLVPNNILTPTENKLKVEVGLVTILDKMPSIQQNLLTVIESKPKISLADPVFDLKEPSIAQNFVTIPDETKPIVATNFITFENKMAPIATTFLSATSHNLSMIEPSDILIKGQSDIAPIPDPYCPSGPDDLFIYLFQNVSSSPNVPAHDESTTPGPKSGRFVSEIIPENRQPLRPILAAPIAPILPPHSAIKPEIPFKPQFHSQRPTIIIIPPPIYEPPLAKQTEPHLHSELSLAPPSPPFSSLNLKKFGPSQAPSVDGMPPTLLTIVEPQLASSPPPYAPLNFDQLKKSDQPLSLEMLTEPPKIIVQPPLAPSPPVFSQLTRRKQISENPQGPNETIYSSIPPIIIEPPLAPLPEPYSILNVAYDNQPPEGYTMQSIQIKYAKNKKYSLVEPPCAQNPVSLYEAKSLIPNNPVQVVEAPDPAGGRFAEGVQLTLRKSSSKKVSHLAASGSTSIAGEKTAISSADAHDATRKKVLAADAAAIVYSGGHESMGRSSVKSKNFDPNCKKCVQSKGKGEDTKNPEAAKLDEGDTTAAAGGASAAALSEAADN